MVKQQRDTIEGRQQTETISRAERARGAASERADLRHWVREELEQYDNLASDMQTMTEGSERLAGQHERLTAVAEKSGHKEVFRNQLDLIQRQQEGLDGRLATVTEQFRPLEARLLMVASQHAEFEGMREEGIQHLEAAVELYTKSIEDAKAAAREGIEKAEGNQEEALEALRTKLAEAAESYNTLFPDKEFPLTEEYGSFHYNNFKRTLGYAVQDLERDLGDQEKIAKGISYGTTLETYRVEDPTESFQTFDEQEVVDGKRIERLQSERQGNVDRLAQRQGEKPLNPFGSERKRWKAENKRIEVLVKKYDEAIKEAEQEQEGLVEKQGKAQEQVDAMQGRIGEIRQLVESVAEAQGREFDALDRASKALKVRNSGLNNEVWNFESTIKEYRRSIENLQVEPDHPIYDKVKSLEELAADTVVAA